MREGGEVDAEAPAISKAMLLVSLCVGGMVLARTTDDPRLRRRLRAASRAEALAVLERGEP